VNVEAGSSARSLTPLPQPLVITSALELITQQLNDLDVDITTMDLQRADIASPVLTDGIPEPPAAPLDWTLMPDDGTSDALEHFPFGDPLNPDDFTIDPAVFESIFETISSIEPLDVSVGAIQDPQSEKS